MNSICYCRTPEEHLLGLNLAFQFSPSWSLVMAADPIPVINSRDFPAKAADPPAVYTADGVHGGSRKWAWTLNLCIVYVLMIILYVLYSTTYPYTLKKPATIQYMFSVDCTV